MGFIESNDFATVRAMGTLTNLKATRKKKWERLACLFFLQGNTGCQNQ